jgi:hypothetical protein
LKEIDFTDASTTIDVELEEIRAIDCTIQDFVGVFGRLHFDGELTEFCSAPRPPKTDRTPG